MIVNSMIAYYLNSYWSGKFINYSIREQVIDIMPSFLLALFMGTVVFLAGKVLPAGYLIKLIFQILFGGVLVFSLCEWFKIDSYLYIKEIIITKLIAIKRVRK
ncbi:MAG: hypothetical protein HQ542_02015 [Bacteroidia bacterium]|nr:hypothetical protein [Bacteroidia bacterium]